MTLLDVRIPASSDASDSLGHRLDSLAASVREYLSAATEAVRTRVVIDGKLNTRLIQCRQRELHGLAWIATTTEAIVSAARWGMRLAQASRLGESERLLLGIGLGEYLDQLSGGIPMSQNEIFRPAERTGALGRLDR